jgi:transposase
MGCGLSKAHSNPEVLVSHRNARLTVHGRLLIVQRRQGGWKQAHIAAAMGVSRKCVKYWLDRYEAEGEAGLENRSSRPHSMPTKTAPDVEEQVLAARAEHRDGPDVLAPKVGVPARTVSRILRRHGVPYLRECDPLTGEVIRSSKQTAVRYERKRPGELVHMDVKKIGRIPDGGGWRAHGRGIPRDRVNGPGYDYIHSLVDDHSRLAYSEALSDEKGATCAAFLERAIAYFAAHGITRIERADDEQRLGLAGRCVRSVPPTRSDRSHPPPCPWQNGKVERAEPHAGHRVGLPPDLHLQRRPHRGPCTLARVLQH